jgi:hypothetical protein
MFKTLFVLIDNFQVTKKYLALAFCLTYMVSPITESVKVPKRKPKSHQI